MAENDVKEWIPSTTGDYTGGKVTFTAGSKDITFENAFNGGEQSFTAGESIYIPTEGRWLLLNEITSTTKGTLLYPCPESCAGTFDLRIRPLSRNARQAGLATMILRNLNTGNLAGLASVKLKTGQILVASQIEGSFYAIELNADNIGETTTHKVMTADERGKIAKLEENYLSKSGGAVSGNLDIAKNLGVNGYVVINNWLYIDDLDPENKGSRGIQFRRKRDNSDDICKIVHMGPSLNIRFQNHGDTAKFHDSGKTEFAGDIVLANKTTLQTTGNIVGSDWLDGNLKQHIENRINSCVTNVRVDGWAQITEAWGKYVTLPSGYFVNSVYLDGEWGTNTRYAGVQPQVFVQNIGWVPIGKW